MKALVTPTPEGQWFSSGVCSDNNPYGIEDNLIFSFPCRSTSNGDYKIVEDVPWDDFLQNKMKETAQELIEERNMVSQLMNKVVK